MAKSKRKMDWWETLLWLGLGILVGVFIYELVKLLSSGQATLADLPGAIGQALDNAITTVESALTSLVTAPLDFFSGFFSAIPNFFSLIFNWISSLFGGSTSLETAGGNIAAAGTSLLPLTSGAGSSASYSIPLQGQVNSVIPYSTSDFSAQLPDQ